MIIPPKSQSYALDPEIQKEILILRHDKFSCNVPLTVPILERDYFYDDDLSDDGPLNPNEYESDDKSIRKFYFNIVHHEPLYILIGSTATLKEKTAVLCQKMRMSKKIKRLEDEVKYNKIEKNLQNKIFPTNIIQNSIQPTIPCNFHPDVNSFQKTLIYDFLKNLSSCFKKHNYGDITKELAFILSTYSHAGYQILRRFLPLPCDSVLYDNFGNSVKLIKEALTDMNQIETMLNFINYPKRQDQIRICLAVDAISFKLFSDCQKEDHLCEEDENPNNCENSNNFENLNDCENFNHENQLKPNDNSEYSTDFSFESDSCSYENEEELPLLCDSSKNDAIDLMLKILRSLTQTAISQLYSDMFISLAMPLDDINLPNIILNVLAYKNGQAGTDVRINLNQLIQFLRNKTRFFVSYACVDGDSGYSVYHLDFYNFWRNESKEKNLNLMQIINLVPIYTQSECLFITDLIHYGKNRRSSLIFNTLTVHPTDPSFFLDVGKIKKAIDLGDILIDLTSLGKMQDIYPIGLFSIPVVKSLMVNNSWHEVLYILPVALWFEAVMNEVVDRSTRILMLKLSLKIHLKFIDTIEKHHLGKYISRAGIVNHEKNFFTLPH